VASLEVTRFATGRKNALQLEVNGSRGGLRFDLERMNELLFCSDPAEGYRQQLVTERWHPYLDALVATGSRAGLRAHVHA
jgi:hypothetical protein